MSEQSADKQLDTKGQVCPMPLIRTQHVLEELEPGQILEVTGDHPASLTDIISAVRSLKAEVLKFENDKDTGIWKVLIKR